MLSCRGVCRVDWCNLSGSLKELGGGSFLSQTLTKGEHNKMRWVVNFFKKMELKKRHFAVRDTILIYASGITVCQGCQSGN